MQLWKHSVDTDPLVTADGEQNSGPAYSGSNKHQHTRELNNGKCAIERADG